jgi:hypothetical protein
MRAPLCTHATARSKLPKRGEGAREAKTDRIADKRIIEKRDKKKEKKKRTQE